jgi:hypothetical protein
VFPLVTSFKSANESTILYPGLEFAPSLAAFPIFKLDASSSVIYNLYGPLGIGCIRFKHGRIRWHTLAYGEAEFFFKHVQIFCAYRTYALYDKHTLGTR